MSLESRIQALEDHCNHSLANAKLIAAGGITSDELKVDALDRPYLGEDGNTDNTSYYYNGVTYDDFRDMCAAMDSDKEDMMGVEELAQENAQLRGELNDAIHLIGELSLELTRLSRA